MYNNVCIYYILFVNIQGWVPSQLYDFLPGIIKIILKTIHLRVQRQDPGSIGPEGTPC